MTKSNAMRRESSAARSKKANPKGARSCPPKGNAVHHMLPFERWARAAWPQDGAKNLGRLIKRSLRTCKYQLAGTRDPSYADVIALLRSEHGFSFLQFMMGDAEPAWWRGIAKARGLASLRKQLADAQRRIAQLEMDFE
jgi:hypothetical protein